MAYSGSFAVSAVVCSFALQPSPHSLEQMPGAFTVLFGAALVPSIPSSVLGALFRWLELTIQGPLNTEEPAAQQGANQIGVRRTDGIRIGTEMPEPVVRTGLYRRSHF